MAADVGAVVVDDVDVDGVVGEGVDGREGVSGLGQITPLGYLGRTIRIRTQNGRFGVLDGLPLLGRLASGADRQSGI